MENKKTYGLNIGASSVLVVIVVLCLVCFAGLSIASANADFRLSEKLATRTSEYYAACNEAQIHLQKISGQLASIYKSTDSKVSYEQKIKESLSDSLTFYCAINENQALQVTVLPAYPTASSTLYRISSWKVVTLSVPELDESLPVFSGS